jgi:tetratricopeptide (TPR) repeat protein
MESSSEMPPCRHEELRIAADDAYRNGNYLAAIGYYNDALDCLERTAPDDSKGRLYLLSWLALSYQQDRDFVTARHFHEAELRLARQMRDAEKIADALHRLGDTYLELKNDARAEACLAESLKLARSLGSQRREIPHLLYDLAAISERGKRFVEATSRYREWITVRQQSGERDVAYGWYWLGTIAARQRDWRMAEDHFYMALVVAQDCGNSNGESWALYGLGRVAYDCEKRQRAEHLIGEALRVSESVRDLRLMASIRKISGNIAYAQEDYQRAAESYIRHVETEYANNSWTGVVDGLQNAAAAYCHLDRAGFAALCFGLVDALKERLGVEYPSQFADRFRVRCRRMVSEETWEGAQKRARDISIPEALAYFSGE